MFHRSNHAGETLWEQLFFPARRTHIQGLDVSQIKPCWRDFMGATVFSSSSYSYSRTRCFTDQTMLARLYGSNCFFQLVVLIFKDSMFLRSNHAGETLWEQLFFPARRTHIQGLCVS